MHVGSGMRRGKGCWSCRWVGGGGAGRQAGGAVVVWVGWTTGITVIVKVSLPPLPAPPLPQLSAPPPCVGADAHVVVWCGVGADAHVVVWCGVGECRLLTADPLSRPILSRHGGCVGRCLLHSLDQPPKI